MLARQNSEGATAEAIKRQQAAWTVSVLKSKLAAKKMTRLDFNKMSFLWRGEFIKNGGRVVD